MKSPYSRLRPHVEQELAASAHATVSHENHAAWRHLERAHVLSLDSVRLHTWVHFRMLALAWRQRDKVEIVGQLVRVALAPLASAFGRSPVGNDGRARSPLTKVMPIEADLVPLLKPRA